MTARPCPNCGYVKPDGDLLPSEIRDCLKSALRAKGMTQEDLARAVGGHPAWVSKLLAGQSRPTKPVAWDIARALDLPWHQAEALMVAASPRTDRRLPTERRKPPSPVRPPTPREVFRDRVLQHLADQGRTATADLIALRGVLTVKSGRNQLAAMRTSGLIAHNVFGYYDPLPAAA